MEATVRNNTWIESISAPGSGKNLNIEIKIDGIEGESNVVFAYTPPSIVNMSTPPLKGGTMEIYGRHFFDKNIEINVNEEGCIRPCADIQFISSSILQCQYGGLGKVGVCDKQLVKVTINGQTSNGMYICYNSDRGDLTGVPSNVQRLTENGTMQYDIGLSLPPDSNVIIHLKPIE